MKTDNYLTLCLEQASNSPLHYRHGCIIVRGGKVIGQGYNDYRPGFDGGALKTGRLAASAFDGPAITELKQKQKQKPRVKSQQQGHVVESINVGAACTKTFTPFEGTGGGFLANTPLSMHSEMMAVQSALSSSGTFSSRAMSLQKPCFKLPGYSKRNARLRREALKSYVERVCEGQVGTGKLQTGKNENKPNNVKNGGNVEECVDVAFHAELSVEKHRMKNQKKNRHLDQYQDGHRYHRQYQYEYSHSGPQKQQRPPQHHFCATKQQSGKIPGHGELMYEAASGQVKGRTQMDVGARSRTLKSDHKPFRKNGLAGQELPPQSQPLLVPRGRTGQSTCSVRERMKHPLLHGADLYVARLGRQKYQQRPSASFAPLTNLTENTKSIGLDSSSDDDLASSTSSLMSTSPPTGSLHDELSCSKPSAVRTADPPTSALLDKRAVAASRPCYRCISYMHSVGIKRVFWTNENGDWEGGKVRDLANALCGDELDDVAGGPAGNGVFVTKHEVLMLRRRMGTGD
ncbi:hypothetical protein B0A49_05050 [Cryomyces minteri]|uniref:Uncharacterized protein n=1 Tax=Cryomyces minteri TaxID=331657 RepID=A0A4U0X189_9PEZI|nr:hypothetical protein B0A49_05050 [Cryomyces minteri]